MKRRGLLGTSLVVLTRPATAQSAAAQPSWPDRPVRLVVPFAGGTTTDILARLAAGFIAPRIGQPVVIDNRSGAGGTVGALAVAQAPADGHTLLFGTSGAMATNPILMPALAYDPLRDFAPIASFARTSVVLGVRPQLGVDGLAGFLALARRRTVSIASAGTGTTGHLTQALLDLRAGTVTTHVPYREGGRAIADLLNGTVDAMVYHPLGFLPHIQAGTIRPLAGTGEARHFLFPDLPTMAEAGLPGVEVEGWWALYAPAGTPGAVVARLNGLVNGALVDPATLAELRRQGLETMGGTPEALARHNRDELTRQRGIVQAAGIKAE